MRAKIIDSYLDIKMNPYRCSSTSEEITNIFVHFVKIKQ